MKLLSFLLILFVLGTVQGKLVQSVVQASPADHDDSTILAEITPDLSEHNKDLSMEDDLVAVVPMQEMNQQPQMEEQTEQEEQLSLDSLPLLKRGGRAASFLESSSTRRRRSNRHGWGVADKHRARAQQKPNPPRLTGAASTLTRANVRCVLCQYLLQRIHADMTTKKPNAQVAAVETSATTTEQTQQEEAEATASFLETYQFASAEDQARIESKVSNAAYADAVAAYPDLFDHGPTPMRRFRKTDVLAHRPDRARFAQIHATVDQASRDAARQSYVKLYASVYSSFETLCSKRMPLAYLPYCNDMLKSYRFFAQGLNYGDRPEAICMNGNFCDHRSYVRNVVHNKYVREPGDA
jgi:hypothetical protein